LLAEKTEGQIHTVYSFDLPNNT